MREEKKRHHRPNFGDFQSARADFLIRFCVSTRAKEVFKRNVYGWEHCKKR